MPTSASQSGDEGQETRREQNENDHKIESRGGGGRAYGALTGFQAVSQMFSLCYYI